MSFAKSFARLNGQPLDKSEIWYNLVDAQAYAATDAAYVGQILAVINTVENSVKYFGITDAAGTLTEIGSVEGIANDIEEVSQAVNNLEALIGTPATDEAAATGLYKDLENLINSINTKADAENVYSKTETDQAIAAAVVGADHLKRKIVNTINDINKNEDDALNYIYMVPTGLQYEDDKYDEYVVIEIDSVRSIEKVGSWEVNLDNYATKDDLIITSVANDFTISENKQLILNELPISKITNLQSLLDGKVDAQSGYTLLSPLDKQKLDKLSIDTESGNLGVSGTISAGNIQGLEEWLNEKASSTPGLSENNFTDELYNKVVNSLFIASVDTNQLNVTEQGHLSIIEIDQTKVSGLTEALNSKATTSALAQVVEDFNTKFDNYVLKSDYETDIAEIREALTWKNMQ